MGNPEEKSLLGSRRRSGRIILKRSLRKWDKRTWTEFVWLRQGQVESCCERGNRHSGLKKKFEEFLD